MSEPTCCVCGGAGAIFYAWGDKWQHTHVWDCVTRCKTEVQRLRDRERRVVRVFWRVRGYACEYASREMARQDAMRWGATMVRVTVRRVKRKVGG